MTTTRRCAPRLATAALAATALTAAAAPPDVLTSGRTEGLLLGSLIGDAAGGPVEFVSHTDLAERGAPFRVWTPGERLKPDDLDAYGDELALLPYTTFRPEPEAYAHWSSNAPAGTLTDDSRQKAIVIDMLARAADEGRPAESLAEADLARAFVRFMDRAAGTPHADLAHEGLGEYALAARWVLGERDETRALPPSRLWGGIGTCAGQMALLPLAGVFPGEPDAAYRLAYDVAFIDNARARDTNAALVAGLAAALATDPDDPYAWETIHNAMRTTDPYRYAEVPWVPRGIDAWLDEAKQLARDADREPAALVRAIDERFAAGPWWDDRTIVVMTFAAIELADHHPLASMRLAIELGHDTDSTAQLVGAFMGALHGPEVFPPDLARPVRDALRREHDASIGSWAEAVRRAGE